MEKIINIFFCFLAFIFGFNSLYVFFLTSDTDYFRVFGMFETNRITAGFIYLTFFFIFFIGLKFKKKDAQ